MSDGGKGGGGGNTGGPTSSELMNQVNQGQVMLTQQNMASLQHQQALQMQQQAASAQQQAAMESMQTSQAQSVSQTQALLVNTANLHQQLQNSSSGNSGQGGMGNQGGSQGGGTTMCLQQGIQSSMASSPSLHQQQQIGSISLQGGGNQSGSTTITTMSTLPQQQQQGQPQQLQQVQVIQQPMQNAYVQQLYNSQGQVLMSALHPNMNSGSIQVIAAGKPFQSNQLTSHMLSKPVLTAANGQQGSFPSYATIPTTTNQTLVITGGQLGVLSGQIPQSQPKPQDLQKAGGGGGTGQVKAGGGNSQTNQQVITQNCVASHPMLHHLISPIQYTTCGNGRQGSVGNQGQAQAVQIASPWQFPQLPQVWATQSPHPQVIQNPIFIRGPQGEQQMFIQQSPPPSQSMPQQQQQQQNVGVNKQDMKSVSNPQVSRTLSILPSSSLAPPIRPATTASTQIVKSQQIKMRTKAILTKSNIPPQKDAQNQTKPGMQSSSPQHPHQILPATKMIITSQGTIVQGPIENKVVGQVTGTQSQTATAVAMPQSGISMPQGAVAMQQTAVMPQNVVHQPQLIQPKPPPLMSLSMPSLEPIPTPADKQMEALPSMEIVPATPSNSLPAPNNDQAQERLSEQNQLDDSVNHMQPNHSQENGQIGNEAKGAEPMEVVEPDPPPIQTSTPSATAAPLSNGISTCAMTNPLTCSMAPTSVTHTSTIGSATPVRSSSPAVSAAVLPNSQMNGQQPLSHEETGHKRPPKAMIKPHNQVLTHIIEGYVIQESSEPFPINRTNLLSELSQPNKAESQNSDSSSEPPVKKQSMDLSMRDDSDVGSDKLKCETCGKIDLKEKFKKKRFCSTQCARRGSTSGRKRSKSKDDEGKTDKEWAEGDNEAPSVIAISDSNSDTSSEPLSNPLKWTVAEVCDFIKNLPGCKEYAEDFAIQEIDGQALILLKPDHLMSAMSMKLGPALKICAKIDTMRTDNQSSTQSAPV